MKPLKDNCIDTYHYEMRMLLSTYKVLVRHFMWIISFNSNENIIREFYYYKYSLFYS